MRKSILVITALIISVTIFAQHIVRLKINTLPVYHTTANDIYAAGSFNGWNPQDAQYKFQQDDKGNYILNLAVKSRFLRIQDHPG